MVLAYIGIGSNLENPLQQVESALSALETLPHSRLIATSRLYRSAPLGPEGQPDYINAVAKLNTALEPERLLDQLQAIENRHGRLRSVRWGPRTLDLDILLYGDQSISIPRLTIPHIEMTRRNFVLYPLADIDPDLTLPDGQRLAVLLDGCPPLGLSVISKTPGSPDTP